MNSCNLKNFVSPGCNTRHSNTIKTFKVIGVDMTNELATLKKDHGIMIDLNDFEHTIEGNVVIITGRKIKA